jgi:hypothetical protein
MSCTNVYRHGPPKPPVLVPGTDHDHARQWTETSELPQIGPAPVEQAVAAKEEGGSGGGTSLVEHPNEAKVAG